MLTSTGDDLNEQSLWEKIGFRKRPPSFATTSIHMNRDSGQNDHCTTLSLINLTSTYKLFEAHNPHGYQYSRFGNPTRNSLEKCLASLENSKFAVTFSSTLGAQTAIIAKVKKGEGIIVDSDVNSDSIRLFRNFTTNMEMELDFVDMSDLNQLANVLKESTRIVWLETPSSRSMKILDVEKISNFIHENSKSAKVVVENTILSNYLQRPLELGADIAVSSITKYMHGYSDVVMGYAAVDDEELHGKIRYHQGAMGIIPSPFDCYMVNKSLKTLALRMENHMQSSLKLAKYLENHPKIDKVFHPALPSHPQHKIACHQSYGHSGVFTFKLKNSQNNEKFMENLKIVLKNETIGSFESYMKQVEIEDGLDCDKDAILLSVGLENVEDLIEDVKHALETVK